MVKLFNVVFPKKFNDDTCVEALLKVVVPDTFNELLIVVILFNVVNPDTFNDDIHVILYVELVYKAPLKTAGNLVELSVDVQSKRFVGLLNQQD